MARVAHATDDSNKKVHSLASMVLKELAMITTDELKKNNALMSTDPILTDSMMIIQFIEILCTQFKSALAYSLGSSNRLLRDPAAMREFLKDPDVRKIIKDMMDY